MTKEDCNKLELRSKLFMYTTLVFACSVLLQFGGMWLTSMVDSSDTGLRARLTILTSLASIILATLTIVGSVWLLVSRQILSKKLSAVLYILITPILIGFSCLMIAFSSPTWG